MVLAIGKSETGLSLGGRRIDQMRPGDWVLAENPTGERDLDFGDEVDPASWRLLAYSATRHSPTMLEPALLASGLSHWEFGRFEL